MPDACPQRRGRKPRLTDPTVRAELKAAIREGWLINMYQVSAWLRRRDVHLAPKSVRRWLRILRLRFRPNPLMPGGAAGLPPPPKRGRPRLTRC